MQVECTQDGPLAHSGCRLSCRSRIRHSAPVQLATARACVGFQFACALPPRFLVMPVQHWHLCGGGRLFRSPAEPSRAHRVGEAGVRTSKRPVVESPFTISTACTSSCLLMVRAPWFHFAPDSKQSANIAPIGARETWRMTRCSGTIRPTWSRCLFWVREVGDS